MLSVRLKAEEASKGAAEQEQRLLRVRLQPLAQLCLRCAQVRLGLPHRDELHVPASNPYIATDFSVPTPDPLYAVPQLSTEQRFCHATLLR